MVGISTDFIKMAAILDFAEYKKSLKGAKVAPAGLLI